MAEKTAQTMLTLLEWEYGTPIDNTNIVDSTSASSGEVVSVRIQLRPFESRTSSSSKSTSHMRKPRKVTCNVRKSSKPVHKGQRVIEISDSEGENEVIQASDVDKAATGGDITQEVSASVDKRLIPVE